MCEMSHWEDKEGWTWTQLMEENCSHYLGSLSEVGGQFKAGDESSLVTHYDDGVNGIEFNVS